MTPESTQLPEPPPQEPSPIDLLAKRIEVLELHNYDLKFRLNCSILFGMFVAFIAFFPWDWILPFAQHRTVYARNFVVVDQRKVPVANYGIDRLEISNNSNGNPGKVNLVTDWNRDRESQSSSPYQAPYYPVGLWFIQRLDSNSSQYLPNGEKKPANMIYGKATEISPDQLKR